VISIAHARPGIRGLSDYGLEESRGEFGKGLEPL
jgi:hypothetical protein